MPYNKLKPNPTPMVGIGKGHVHLRVLPGCKIFYLDDGNRPYCEDWSYIDTVTEMTNHMQQKIHRQALPE